MIKKIIILIVMGLTLSSCQLFTEAIKDNIYRVERERERKELSKKDGPSAIVVDEYKEGVKAAIKDILKRPINKRVEFGETTLLIPENTRLNLKHGNIVDEKTGYGISLSFLIETDGCSNVFYYKKLREGLYYKLIYNQRDLEISKISEKIAKVNGFTKNCK
ncbi:hypothetical protein KST09_08745 [Fusobacterium animalis]|uniref:hypothetical protein n=1 Tax=Fusobacterium animalis TaxID=76859 RepID=UPI0030D1B6CF